MRQQQARAALMYRAPVALFHTTDKNNDPANKVGRDEMGWDGMGRLHSRFTTALTFTRACVLARFLLACSLARSNNRMIVFRTCLCWCLITRSERPLLLILRR